MDNQQQSPAPTEQPLSKAEIYRKRVASGLIPEAPGVQTHKDLYEGMPEGMENVLKVPTKILKPESDFYISVDKKKFIEEQFLIRAKEEQGQMGYIIPFKFNKVQQKYYDIMSREYNNFEGVREIILKARQQGFSTFVLALFAVDFITRPNSVSMCISYRSDETKRLFKRVHFYVESYCEKNGWDVHDYLSVDTKDELENATNGAYFYIGTAGAKVGGRGATVTNLHFSEAAFFEDTDKITAKEIIEATAQQVPQDHGMVFIESTGSQYGTYYQQEWERAKDQKSNYKPRFFPWQDFYSKEWIEKKKKDFSTEDEFHSHYPSDETEAFIFSGRPYFDRKVLEKMMKEAVDPIQEGHLAPDGSWI
jgi:hypothetical protein